MRKRITLLVVVVFFTLACSTQGAVRIFATATPAATATPTVTPTATPPPTATPTPTPPPTVRIDNGDHLLFAGDYEHARREYQDAQANSSDPEIQAAAALGMGRSLFLAKNHNEAIDTLEDLIQNHPKSAQLASAYFFLGESYEAVQIYDKAAEAFGKYLEIRPGVLDAYMHERRGDAYLAANNPGAAVGAYQAAILAQGERATQSAAARWVDLSLGKAYAAQGDFSNAIKTYLDVYQNSSNDYARAQANFLMGQAYLSMGMPEQAHARFLDNIASFPKAYDSYSGLVQLINNGVQVNELSRGMVDYYAGQYGLAVEAFTRFIDANPQTDAAPYYYRALSHMFMNEPGNAITDLDLIIEKFREDDHWADAWDEKAYIQWAYLDEYEEAAQTLLKYVETAPQSGRAPELLFQAARIQERNNQLPEAAATWERVMDSYPSAEQSYRSLFLAGITYFRAADYPKALTVFQRTLVLATTPNEQAAAYLWIGKTQHAQGETAAARTSWEQGAQRDPTGYYSERCNELLQNKAPFTITRPVDLGYDLDKERAQAETWLRSTFTLAPETDLSWPGELAGDARIQRAAAFWELGLYELARNEIEDVRKSNLSDPAKTYRLMNYALDLGLYRTAILSSRQILDLANLGDVDTLKAPAFFNHIRFGVYFKDQIMESSQEENFHPLFLLSVMRQESMFEGFAISSAGARGLMQIMPATGQEIVSSINWPENFSQDDLYRPDVSITLGARYLARQRDYFNGNPYATLAAYNGGPGNTNYWIQLSSNDLDLFLEVIRADETRKYITQIYEYFNIYRLMYERGL